jgi:UDP:flavonoid glycosyltransferase YjiC (YdhE family)
MSSQPTVALFPEPGAWGPTNNLVALGNHLRERGIRAVFVIEESFEGELAKRGFEERLMRMAPPPEGEETVGGGWAEFVRETSPQFRRPTIEQLETVTAPIWAEFADGAEYSHDRLTEIWSELRPDAIVHDCVASFPSVSLAGCPWIRVVSANPLEITDPDIPPVFSGYPSRDRSGWEDFSVEYRRLTIPSSNGHRRFTSNAAHHHCRTANSSTNRRI